MQNWERIGKTYSSKICIFDDNNYFSYTLNLDSVESISNYQ